MARSLEKETHNKVVYTFPPPPPPHINCVFVCFYKKGTDKRHHKQWYYFKAANVQGAACSFKITNAGECSYPEAWPGSWAVVGSALRPPPSALRPSPFASRPSPSPLRHPPFASSPLKLLKPLNGMKSPPPSCICNLFYNPRCTARILRPTPSQLFSFVLSPSTLSVWQFTGGMQASYDRVTWNRVPTYYKDGVLDIQFTPTSAVVWIS